MPPLIEATGSVPFRELYDGTVRVADVKLTAYEHTFFAIFFFKNLDPFRDEEAFGIVILVRINLKCVMRPCDVFPKIADGRITHLRLIRTSMTMPKASSSLKGSRFLKKKIAKKVCSWAVNFTSATLTVPS